MDSVPDKSNSSNKYFNIIYNLKFILIIIIFVLICLIMYNTITTTKIANDMLDYHLYSTMIKMQTISDIHTNTNERLSSIESSMNHRIDEIEYSIQVLSGMESPRLNDIQEMVRCTIAAYNPLPEQTSGDPFTTADGTKVKTGIAAVSRDLLKRWGGKEAFGRKIHIIGFGEFEIRDTTSERFTNRVDIFMWEKNEAILHGRRDGVWVALLIQKNYNNEVNNETYSD